MACDRITIGRAGDGQVRRIAGVTGNRDGAVVCGEDKLRSGETRQEQKRYPEKP